MAAERPPPSGRAALNQLAGMGVELAATMLAFGALGYWIDSHWKIVNHWGLLICSLIGIVGGLYNLIRKAVHESLGVKPPERPGLGDKPSGREGGGTDGP